MILRVKSEGNQYCTFKVKANKSNPDGAGEGGKISVSSEVDGRQPEHVPEFNNFLFVLMNKLWMK